MNLSKEGATPQILSLPEELILMLLNEESGYFHQVPGWDLNCAVIGAVLAELSLISCIDTDLESLFLTDQTATGNPILDPILKEIASEPTPRKTQYWIERLAPRAESIIDSTLERLVEMNILRRHEGDYWTLAPNAWRTEVFNIYAEEDGQHFIRDRISRAIFNDEIPSPRDVITICLINTCDVFRFMYQLDEQAEERIRFICQMDLIGRSIADAVSSNLAGPLLRRSTLAKEIPTVPLRKLAFHPHLRTGNVSALFCALAQEYGPVFQISPPFREPMIVLAGQEANRWVHRNGRLYLRAKDHFADFEKLYHASGILPTLDGADHFRLRKALQPAYSRGRLMDHLEQLYSQARTYMAGLTVGETLNATRMCRRMVNSQISPIMISVDSQDIIDDLIEYKERALSTHLLQILPKFMLKTPGMKRRGKAIGTLVERVQSVHTPAQRAGSPRDLADDLLSLHASEPQLVPESNLRFALSAAAIASMYVGDTFSFALYAMVSQPELYDKIQNEADALFENGDPSSEDLTRDAIAVTHRFLMECLRMYPIAPVSIRAVMNSFMFEDYEIPVGSQVFVAQTAPHYMEDAFPDPFTFDIDRYLPPRNEHLGPGYAPYGLGTHTCLGQRWLEVHLGVNLLMLAHYFKIEIRPENYKLKISPIPSPSPNKKLKFHIAERRREIPV